MATLISKATGNLTAETTWNVAAQVVDGTGLAVVATAPSWTQGTAFTPGAIVIDGILIKVAGLLGTTGTITVRLYNTTDSIEVAGTSITINLTDFPATVAYGMGWFNFSFVGTPVTLEAAHNYRIEAQISSSTQVYVYVVSGNNLTKMLRTTTTGTPSTSDSMHIIREFTGAGTGNNFVVTMNSVASTDYGAITIGKGGTLNYGYAESTNYYLKCSGDINLYSEGVFTIGTVTNPIPRNSTAVLEFDPASAGGFGLKLWRGTFTVQGLSRTVNKDIWYCKLNTDEAVNQTELGVDEDTGWLDNDEIAIGSTSRTYSEYEKGTLNGNADTSHLDVDGFAGVSGGLAYSHLGTDPRQAEIILLTRNVKIRSTSASNTFYIYVDKNMTIDIDWTEIYNIGYGATTQCGTYILNTFTGNFDIKYSCIHNSSMYGIKVDQDVTAGTILIKYCSFYLCAGGAYYQNEIQGDDIEFSYNIVMACGVSNGGVCIYLCAPASDYSFTHNIISSCQGNGVYLAQLQGTYYDLSAFPVFNNITIHSCGLAGIITASDITLNIISLYNATMSDISVWRCENGIQFKKGIFVNLIMNNIIAFENTQANICFGLRGVMVINLNADNWILNGGDTYYSQYNLEIGQMGYVQGKITNLSSGETVANTIADIGYTQRTLGYAWGGWICGSDLLLVNPVLSSVTKVSISGIGVLDYVNMAKIFNLKITKYQGVAGSEWAILKGTKIEKDTLIYKIASPSTKMTPLIATKMESSSKKVIVASGNTVSISTWVRESVIGDGTDYDGDRIRLILKANPSCGIASDVVLDTATVLSEGEFEELLGTTDAVTADGVLEFVIDFGGTGWTAGWVNVDDFSATVA